MNLSDVCTAYFLNGRLRQLQETLEDINQGASAMLMISTDENSSELQFDEDMRASLCGFLQAEIDKCKRELIVLGVDVEG